MEATVETNQASERQLRYLRDLLGRKQVTPATVHDIEAAIARGMSIRQASILIDGLLRLPNRPTTIPTPKPAGPCSGDQWPNVPEGRYAVTDPDDGILKFYQVDKPQEGRWAGFTFLSVMASNERHPIKAHDTKRRILDVIAAEPREAAARYGQELGICGVCGRALTDEASRARGIGPVCAAKRGWLDEGAEDQAAQDDSYGPLPC